jgi:7-cyano-7-deazaguanine reductase
MPVPDLSKYLEGYKGLESKLESLGDGDPVDLLIPFPLGSVIETKGRITIEFNELTAFCPWTRFPDQGSLIVKYKPNRVLLELKSFKYYLLAFRDRHITQEHLAVKILDDLCSTLNPDDLSVTLDYMPRGGLHTVIELHVP